MSTDPEPLGVHVDEHEPVFVISVAARLAGLHPQTLRQYDRLGVASPTGGTGTRRLYSRADIARLRRVAELTAEGVSLAAVPRLLALEDELRLTRREVLVLRAYARANPPRPSTDLVRYRPRLPGR